MTTTPSTTRRILLIDDDAAVRSAISLILDQGGYTVVDAEDGYAGLDLVKTELFDLAIVDMFMPGLDGLETIAQIRQQSASLPIIATSGAVGRSYSGATSDVLAAAADKGASCVIHKPFRPRELLEAIAKCLSEAVPPGAPLP